MAREEVGWATRRWLNRQGYGSTPLLNSTKFGGGGGGGRGIQNRFLSPSIHISSRAKETTVKNFCKLCMVFVKNFVTLPVFLGHCILMSIFINT
jgi:hypothetical protein